MRKGIEPIKRGNKREKVDLDKRPLSMHVRLFGGKSLKVEDCCFLYLLPRDVGGGKEGEIGPPSLPPPPLGDQVVTNLTFD